METVRWSRVFRLHRKRAGLDPWPIGHVRIYHALSFYGKVSTMDQKAPSLAILAATLLVAPTYATVDTLALTQLFAQGLIKMNVTGTGDHQGKCVKVIVTNTSSKPINTSIPAGWRFESEQGPVQDLLVVSEQMIALGGNRSVTVVCTAFCCEASGVGPRDGEHYRRGKLATPDLVAVAKAIAKGDYPNDLAQHAIWTISDSHDIASMGALAGTPDDTLRMVVSRLSGQPPPLYTMRFVDEEGVICSERPGYVERSLPIDLAEGTILTVLVIDGSGKIMQVLYDHTPFPAITDRRLLSVDVGQWPPGRYAFMVHTNDRPGVHRLPFVI